MFTPLQSKYVLLCWLVCLYLSVHDLYKEVIMTWSRRLLGNYTCHLPRIKPSQPSTIMEYEKLQDRPQAAEF